MTTQRMQIRKLVFFGKILGKIKSLGGNKIVLLNNFATVGTLATNNKVITDLATKFNCIVVDIKSYDVTNTKYHTSYNGFYNSVHFNSSGNNYIANIVVNTIDEYLKTHQNDLELYKIHS